MTCPVITMENEVDVPTPNRVTTTLCDSSNI
jgi:hypothetical protein